MDLSFLRRAEARFAAQTAANPDFGMLRAMLATQQSASPAVQAQGHFSARTAIADPLVEILLVGPLWREARRAQRGAFNVALARKRVVN